MKLYADIVLPLALPPFTFEVADVLSPTLGLGMAVEVPLGERKIYAGIVWRLHNTAPNYKKIKVVRRAIRPERLVDARQMALWEWVADYYMCSLGEVMRAALPASLKPSALSVEEFDESLFTLPRERFVKLSPSITTEERLNAVFEALGKRAKGQVKALTEFCSIFDGDFDRIALGAVRVADMQASDAVIRQLIAKSALEIEEREREPRPKGGYENNLATLTDAQSAALAAIRTAFESRDTVLLNGVTSSGKTEIYMRLAAEMLDSGRSVLYLLPEIAVTKQLIDRFTAAFGNSVTAYHSKYTVRNRTENYLRLCRSGGAELIIGVRSAIFLPAPNLGLIIVDEEHDRSFKQDEPAPRYSARDAAVWIARNSGAKTLLGSATPSIESYANALSGLYGYVTLTERYGNGRLPQVELSDTIRSAKRGERRGHFNKELRDAVDNALRCGRQAILFQNRRGFAPYIECADCGWTPHCPHCGVALTLYKTDDRLRCNLCGYTTKVPTRCPSCKVATPEPRGFGTEKIESTAAELFPDARIARLDGDTAASKGLFARTIDDFAARRTDILVGTQMIAKGFDFGGVEVVGVMNADNLLNYPDFRASERAFQTLTQVAGRAGRTDAEGRVVIQTAQPENNTLREVVRGDYRSMADEQLREREQFGYPPYARLVALTLKHPNVDLLFRGGDALASHLRQKLGNEAVTDAHAPVVGRVSDLYVAEIIVRIPREQSPRAAKAIIADELHRFVREPLYRKIAVVINVDPQ